MSYYDANGVVLGQVCKELGVPDQSKWHKISSTPDENTWTAWIKDDSYVITLKGVEALKEHIKTLPLPEPPAKRIKAPGKLIKAPEAPAKLIDDEARMDVDGDMTKAPSKIF